ncbi:caspase-2-like [Hydractinia symbiolongicarpus]|uniref:caspase-2-like n=1 Tax=Hydractinia symbiolongicarpus TaxID=13093 RepID=UPI00254B9AE8|nr:caspase-2-like [Hydractinia symbiolongicarpus]
MTTNMAHDEDEILKVYAEWKRDVLEEKRYILCKDIDPQRFFPFLRSKQILDQDNEEDINYERTRLRRAERFLDILVTKGPDAFDYFCEALLTQVAGQLHLLKEILEALDDKREDISDLNHRRELPPLRFSVPLPTPGQIGGPELPFEPPPAYVEVER